MMRFLIIFWFCILCLSSSTCKKERSESLPNQKKPIDNEVSQLTLVWRNYLADNKGPAYSNNPILNSRNDILMSSLFNPDGREIFKLFDGKNGELKWKWDDYLRDEEDFSESKHVVINNALILSAYNATYALDITSGQTLWKNYIDTMYGSHMVFSDGDYIYKGFTGEHGRYKSYIFRTRYDHLNWELVCTYTDSTNTFDQMGASTINFANNDKGERLVLFPLTQVDSDKHSAVLCCYNLNTRAYEWIKDYSDKYLEFRVAKAVAHDDKYFVHTVWGPTWYLVAINIKDGTIAWQNTQPDFGVSLFMYQDKLISLCNRTSPVVCLDPNSGSTIWQQTFASQPNAANLNFTFGDAVIFKNYLISTQCDYLIALDLNNGQVIANKTHGEGCLQYGIAINEQDRTFYVQDRTYVNCFKLPDEIKY